MKRCPQCGAEYDDYVQYCFVDGAELTAGSPTTPHPAALPPHATPAPAPVSAPPPGHGAGHGAGPGGSAMPPPRSAPPPPEPRSSPVWAILAFLLVGAALLAFGAVAVALLVFGNKEKQDTPQPVADPMPPIEAPSPTPAPKPSAVVRVQFESTPPEAQVWEQDKYLCTTPCLVEQPEYAPLPREFVLRLDGHLDTVHQMADTETQRVTLKPVPPKPAPVRPRPSAESDIIPTR